ncbi:response regulator [Donghicola tyrosinivorans]|uniref:Response regulatory domain-containing protein n=1 Tax=Donghicola tyrosinivorans TaxID=1652492 RepID=A0A2T0WNI8_9RHOB|nr:response regulator [Donghicola tyrosinivorans]PRY88266.1 hypothetical protein CLV74_10870 [Donghicola tyrosinivorans]
MEFETVEILIAEDEELDRFLLEHAFKAQMLNNPLKFFENGRELLDYLDTRLGEQMHERFIILTDINMPRMCGFELLANLNAHPALRHIPAFVLSSSHDESDVQKASDLGISGYISKENAGEDFLKGLQMIGRQARAS